jgi:hypothetical protein
MGPLKIFKAMVNCFPNENVCLRKFNCMSLQANREEQLFAKPGRWKIVEAAIISCHTSHDLIKE